MSDASQFSLFGSRAKLRESSVGTGASETATGVQAEAISAPGATVETAVPVSELNAAARSVLEASFDPLWVVGEVANWRRMKSGQCYFSLRDESAQLPCVMWGDEARRLPADPEEGMEVCAYGRVSLYEGRGLYQLVVRRLEARGEGLWRLAFERTLKKLDAEGLTDPARRRPLPAVPRRVGVVTSRKGAALRDVVSVIRRRAPWTHVLLSPCRVQGEGAAREIVRAVESVARFPGVDVVVLTRGGGSVEDLWCFNEEAVARAVADCRVPIVTAVGHEVDVTIADLVADRRAPTPSAAGELVVPDAAELRAGVRRLSEAVAAALHGRARRAEARAARAAERVAEGVERFLERSSAALERFAARLEALSPLATLDRGYAVPLGEDGRILRRLAAFSPGDLFRLRVVDGEIGAKVESTRGEVRS